VLSTVPQFSGSTNEGVAGVPSIHPRSTGTLLAEDASGDHLYAATFAQGVMRSDDGGVTWKPLGLAGSHLRGLAFDPSSPDTLYVGAYNDGVYVTTHASTTGTLSRIAGSPTNPEELLVLGDSLYVAGGKDGVFRTRDGGSTWQQLGGTSVPTGGPIWMSITGYDACGRDVVYAGAMSAGKNAIVRTADGGATWTSLTADPALIHHTLGGPGGRTWWLNQASSVPGGSSYVPASILTGTFPPVGTGCLDPNVLLAGRAGVWGSRDAGQDWYPMMQGLGVTIARDVAADPSVTGRTFVGDADWVFHHSSDALSTVTQKKPPGETAGTDIAIDPATGRVFLATGNPTKNGEVFSSANPATNAWTDEGLSSVAAGRLPLAVAAQTFGTQRILIVAVEGNGIWRKVGGTWAKVNGVAMATWQPSRGASLAWAPGSSTIFLFDHESGVWRSSDRGMTWTKIWTIHSSVSGTGYLAIDPTAPGRLYVSAAASGVWRIDGATTGSVTAGTLTPTLVFSSPVAGPIDVGSAGDVWVAVGAGPGVAARLSRSTDAGATWTVMSDAFYAAAGGFPLDLAVAPDGHVFLATNGDGVLVGST